MDFYTRKILGSLRPADAEAEEALASIPDHALVRVKTTLPRSLPHHKLFFGLLHKVHKQSAAADRWPKFEDFRDIVTIGVGHYRWVESPSGGRWPKAESIAWHKMDQSAFNDFFNAAVVCISEKLKLVDEPDLRREWDEMLGASAA